jgi:hypothetical protein
MSYKNTYSHDYKDYTPCYTTHPALPVGKFLIYGGSCSSPIVKDADIYIGFDHSMRISPPAWPWQVGHPKAIEVLFPITDMSAPSKPADFKELVDWVCNQLQAGKKIHAGCIGGHGRTGTFLAAVVKQMTGEEDAITFVRKNYCDRAVESSAQMKFLLTHYGIKSVTPTKEQGVVSGGVYFGKNKKVATTKYPPVHDFSNPPASKPAHTTPAWLTAETKVQEIVPARSRSCLWGQRQ